MRCARIHDRVYDDALAVIQSLGPDSAPVASAALEDAYASCARQAAFHDWHAFCTDYGCDGWGRVNRWSERVQRGW